MVTPEQFDEEWKSGDRDLAREMARAYVDANGLDAMRAMSIEELVEIVKACRRVGDEHGRIVADMVLLATHAPQAISGSVNIGPAEAVAIAEAFLAEQRAGQ